jgi:hypothetical protein
MITSLGIAGTAEAQSLPSDCSRAAIADGPLVLRMTGAPDQPLLVAKVTSLGKMSTTDYDGKETSYNELELAIYDRSPDGLFDHVKEITTAFLVGIDQAPDNRIFRKPPAAMDTPEYDAQETVGGQVVFQAWGVKIPAPAGATKEYTVDLNHVGYIASARVEFGKRSGSSLPGKIHLCVPGNQTGMFGDEPSKTIEVVGSFIATVE